MDCWAGYGLLEEGGGREAFCAHGILTRAPNRWGVMGPCRLSPPRVQRQQPQGQVKTQYCCCVLPCCAVLCCVPPCVNYNRRHPAQSSPSPLSSPSPSSSSVRRAVPLAMALLNVSDPGQQVVDALSRLSHDGDTEVCGSGEGVRKRVCQGHGEHG